MYRCLLMEDIDLEAIHKKIGENVARYRKEKGLSQLKLSLEMGHSSVSVVSSAEQYNSSKHFNINHIFQIAKILDVDVCKLLEQEEV